METQFLNHQLHNDFWIIPEMNQAKKLVYDVEHRNKVWLLTIMSSTDDIFDVYTYNKEKFLREDVSTIENLEIEMIPLYTLQN